ncbi:pyrroline-5-carboxylate reductase [Sphingomonas lenta]|uniref:pyrroline-5-carboxylate reductase n=1 Tax=Sphingomonas lenta TaxID=1141887 RepID=UPI002481F90A|nr:pyrroline-5-carboxylate reductase [Sphingomonas lenta]
MLGTLTGAVWLLGCGNMGGAMLRRWLAAGLRPDQVTVITRTERALPDGVRWSPELPRDAAPDVLLLAVKPQQLDAVTPAVQAVRPKLLLSILAGVEEAALRRRFHADAIIRAMPNLPVAIGKGVTALFGSDVDGEARRTAEALCAPLGHHEWIADEALFDAVTALAGSGPGFLFRFIDALGAAGAALGLPEDQARRLALATVEGSAIMAASSDDSPAALADKVASPGGSTREGLNVLDRDGVLVRLLTETLRASERRNREMAAAAR